MEIKKEEKENKIPKWLKELQENSWELELLISGGAIFTLFQMSDIWIDWMETMRISSSLPGRAIFLILGVLGIEVLKIGFISHLILRALWLSMVCVNYVFPNGINQEKLKWKKPFNFKLNSELDLKSPIIRVDKACGLIMYLSIISTFLFSGIMISLFLFLTLPLLLGFELGIISNILFIGFLAYLLDLITYGLFRKIPYLTYLFYPVFQFYDYITLRKLFQKSGLLFSTNISKWKFSVGIILYLTITITLSYLNIYKIMHWPNIFDAREYRWQMTNNTLEAHYNFYKDEIPTDKLHRSPFYIQSKIISDSYIELFIQYRVMFDNLINLSDREIYKRSLSEITQIKINDSIYSDIKWVSTTNPSNIQGITAMISIENLKDEMHILHLSCSNTIKAKAALDEHLSEMCQEFSIPFWKDTEVTISK